MSDEGLSALFQEDTLVATEFFDHLRKRILAEPEKRLMFAVLEDAVGCFQKNVLAKNAKQKKIFADAEKWILNTEDDWLFSFTNVCDSFGITPQYLLQGLMSWKQERLAKRSRRVGRLQQKAGRGKIRKRT